MTTTQLIADAIQRVGNALASHIETLHSERDALAAGDLDAVAALAARKRHETVVVQKARAALASVFGQVSNDLSPATWIAKQDELLQNAYADLLGKTRLAQELTQGNGRLVAALINITQSRLAVLQGHVTQPTYGRLGYAGGAAPHGAVAQSV